MKGTIKVLLGVAALAIGLASVPAHALTFGPGDAIDGSTLVPPTGATNCEAACVEQAFGLTAGSLTTLLYKADVGDANNPDTTEEGSFADNYTTTFSNAPLDPADATIVWDGSPEPYISCPNCYMAIKDGSATPSYYFINLNDVDGSGTPWNGQETISLVGFWPDGGAISHVSIWGGDPPGTVPEPSTLLLLGTGLIGMCYVSRRNQKNGAVNA